MKGGRGNYAFDEDTLAYLADIRRRRKAIPTNAELAQALGVHIDTLRLAIKGKYDPKARRKSA